MILLEKLGHAEPWPSGQPKPMGRFRCEHCNAEVVRPLYRGLKNLSCGCMKPAPKGKANWKYSHGECGSKLYWVWATMIARCKDTSPITRRTYLDRGITVCQEWQDAATFIDWAKASGYRHGLMIDRKDNEKGYSPENCRWVTPTESARNKRATAAIKARNALIVKAIDKGMSRTDASKIFGVSYDLVKYVYRKSKEA